MTLTNCDRISYRGSHARLGQPMDVIITAQDVGSYKPARRNFEVLLERVQSDFGMAPSDILHVAQSLYHDHVPAIDLGLATAWIDRRHGAKSTGATKPPRADFSTDRIAFRFTSMADLVRAHRAELTAG
jgi:FMN phosphatase YigB (HAD superfamily)